jgi:cellulose synthase operon protein C
VRREIGEALNFRPPLREYFITTTAPDDANLQQLAAELALEQKEKGRFIQLYVRGWNTLQERISEHAAALKAFDPTYGSFSDQILGEVGRTVLLQ